MIDLIRNTAGTKNEPIVRWTVIFFVSALGVFLNRDEALQKAEEIGLNPLIAVIPLPAAVTATEMEVCFR